MYPFKRINPVSRKPFEDSKLFTFSNEDRNRKSSIVLIEIRFLDSQTFFEVGRRWLFVSEYTTVDLCFRLGR